MNEEKREENIAEGKAVSVLGGGFYGVPADVDEVLEDTANILPVGDYTWATAST